MPISITRGYTRTGDKGETSLVGGKRIPKDSPRIVAYGTVDELNAVVGLVRVFNAERLDEGERHRWLDEVLRKIQNQLFDLGSELATPADAEYDGMFNVGEGSAAPSYNNHSEQAGSHVAEFVAVRVIEPEN